MKDDAEATPEVLPNPNAPIIFAREGSPALAVLTRFAGRVVPGAIFSVTADELASMRKPEDMLVIRRG